jgi:hypothetical protein
MRAAMTVITVISLLAVGCAAGRPPDAPASAARHRSAAAGQPRPVNAGSIRAVARLVARRIELTGDGRTRPGEVVKYRDVEYYASVSNVGMAHSFTDFATAAREITVQPSSAAHVAVVRATEPRFAAPSERARWEAAGKPALPGGPAKGQEFSIPAGSYSFIPQGDPLTYRQMRSLSGVPQAIVEAIAARVRSFAGAHPPVTVMMMQLGFLLATAPLPRATRSAAWSALASLPGLHLCGLGRDLAGRRGQQICASTPTEEVEVLMDTGTGSVLAVSQRILRTTSWFPGVPDGSVVQSDAFIPGS